MTRPMRWILPFVLGVAAAGCTVLDLWDDPVVTVDPRPCNDDGDCTDVGYVLPDELASERCVVAVPFCDSDAHRCNVDLGARDSDGDGYRDLDCADRAAEFAPTRVDCNDLDADAFPDADLDDDGFYARGCGGGKPEDCDDSRATAYPGQTVEACDGVFSLCVDTTAPARRLVEDFDGDRFAPVGLDGSVCADVPARNGNGLASIARTDCDDADALVYPLAPDICDGRNNDCLSTLGVGSDADEDRDGDGYASPSTTACDSSIVGGYPTTDCDDADGKTYPTAPESCDFLINDCENRLTNDFARLSEDPDGDEYFAGDADCIDPYVNIECNGSGFDRFARFCAPRREVPIASGLTTSGTTAVHAADLNGDGIDEVLYAAQDGCSVGSSTLVLVYSLDRATPLASKYVNLATCSTAEIVRIEAAEIDGTANAELAVFSSTGAFSVYDVGVAGSTMSLALSGTPLTGIAAASGTTRFAAAAVGELDGTAGAEIVARMAAGGIVWGDVPANGSTAIATTAIDASTLASTARGVEIADVTGDGDPDVVAYFTDSTMLSTYPGAAATTFGTPATLDVATLLAGMGPIFDVAIGDVEGAADGDLDLVVRGAVNVGTTDQMGLLANRGSSFEGVTLGVSVAGAPLAIGALRPTDVGVRDLEGDGRPDILFASRADDTVGYFEEIGSNLFAHHVAISDLDGAERVDAGDVDGDGDADPVVYANVAATVEVLEATFVSEFSFQEKSVDRAFDSVSDTAIGDIDRDGRLDVVALSSAADEGIHVWRVRSIASSTFDESTAYAGETGVQQTAFALGDANGDDRLDIVVVARNADRVRFVRGNGDTTFGDPEDLLAVDAPSDVEFADLDGDGSDEVLVACQNGADGRVAVYQRPTGAPAFERTILVAGSAPCVDVAAGDIDDDDDLDLALACGTSGLFVYSNPGMGGGAWTETVVDSDVANNYGAVLLADLDGDGDSDLVAGVGANGVAMQMFAGGLPSGALLRSDIGLGGALGSSLAVADFDRDGDADIVASGIGPSGSVRLLQAVNPAAGRYTRSTIVANANFLRGMATGDLNGDGYPDLSAAIFGDSDIVFWATGGTPWWEN